MTIRPSTLLDLRATASNSPSTVVKQRGQGSSPHTEAAADVGVEELAVLQLLLLLPHVLDPLKATVDADVVESSGVWSLSAHENSDEATSLSSNKSMLIRAAPLVSPPTPPSLRGGIMTVSRWSYDQLVDSNEEDDASPPRERHTDCSGSAGGGDGGGGGGTHTLKRLEYDGGATPRYAPVDASCRRCCCSIACDE